MPDKPLAAHSLAEVYLYLMATPCPLCARGPLESADPQPHRTGRTGLVLHVQVTCGACKATNDLRFEVPADAGMVDRDAPPRINDTDDPSELIDLAQWVTLFRTIADAAAKQTDKQEARRLGIEAALCLEEAMKFYEDDGNDLPPAGAFWSDASKARFRDRPEQFSRRRLAELRAKLPTVSRMITQSNRLNKEARRPWWKVWGKR